MLRRTFGKVTCWFFRGLQASQQVFLRLLGPQKELTGTRSFASAADAHFPSSGPAIYAYFLFLFFI